MWLVKCYGQFITGFGDNEKLLEFEVEGKMPDCSEIYIRSFCFARYLKIWIGQAQDKNGNKIYPIVNRIREAYISHYEKIDEKIEFKGKDILKMSWEELLDFATKFDMRDVNGKGTGKIEDIRKKVAIDYLTKIRGLDLTEYKEYRKVPGGFEFDFHKLKDGIKVFSDKKKEEEIEGKSLSETLKEYSNKIDEEFEEKNEKIINSVGEELKLESKKKKTSQKLIIS